MPTTSHEPDRVSCAKWVHPSKHVAIIICALLLILFASISWLAVTTKSPTYDEPYHAMSAWLQWNLHDYRLDYQDPPLWQYWASLPNGRRALMANFDSPSWEQMPRNVADQWYWGMLTLYRTPANDPVRFINRCRAMLLVMGVLLGVLICRWTWRIGGAIAGIIATALFCLDPNFLAHSALMKNDVVFCLSLFALVMCLWNCGRKLSVGSTALLGMLCVVTLTVKFSGVVAVLAVPLLLGCRALSSQSWLMFGRSITIRTGRVSIAIGVTIFTAAISIAGIWAVYGFRFAPTPLPNVWLNLDEIVDHTRVNQWIVQHHGTKPEGMPANLPLPLAVNAAIFANQHGLLPQAYIGGFLFTYSTSMVRYTYALGSFSIIGWWWYFPFTMLAKTPLTTLSLAAITAWLAIKKRRQLHSEIKWTALCLIVPIILYLSMAMASDLNIGIRHILPIYPFIFVIIGCMTATLWQEYGKNVRRLLLIAAIVLAIESLSTFPNFIPFFNVIAANSPGGKRALLGDSNLDWGQDLPLLADWQHEHPSETLYLCYFGYADPQYYKIKYIPLPGGYRYDPPPHFVDPYTPSVVAISATNLQGILLDEKLRDYYTAWAKHTPRAVLGDSIYLYDYNPMQGMAPR